MTVFAVEEDIIDHDEVAREKFCEEKLAAATQLLRSYYPSLSQESAESWANRLASKAFRIASYEVSRPPASNVQFMVGGYIGAVTAAIVVEALSILHPEMSAITKKIAESLTIVPSLLVGTIGLIAMAVEKRGSDAVSTESLREIPDFDKIHQEAEKRLCQSLRKIGCRIAANQL